MSELKTYKMVDEKYCTDCVCVIPSEVYLKSEADKVIAEKDKVITYARALVREDIKLILHQKYKRCLAMARWCSSCSFAWSFIPEDDEVHKSDFYKKWEKRWLELAEKFKEAK